MGRRAFSSWPLSFQKLDSGQPPNTLGFPRLPPFSIGSLAGSASAALHAGRASPAPCREPLSVLFTSIQFLKSLSSLPPGVPLPRPSLRRPGVVQMCVPGSSLSEEVTVCPTQISQISSSQGNQSTYPLLYFLCETVISHA